MKCGEEKRGAFLPCAKCGFIPKTEDEFAKSTMLTDHYFDNETLGQIGCNISRGKEIQFRPEDLQNFVDALRESQIMRMVGAGGPTAASPSKKRWWRVWRR